MTLEWKHMPWHRHAAGAWRLIADADTLAAVKAALPIDISAWSSGGGLLCIQPETDAGREWCADHINAEAHAGVYLAEHRYGPDILLAAHNAGLIVALDGQVADGERETHET